MLSSLWEAASAHSPPLPSEEAEDKTAPTGSALQSTSTDVSFPALTSTTTNEDFLTLNKREKTDVKTAGIDRKRELPPSAALTNRLRITLSQLKASESGYFISIPDAFKERSKSDMAMERVDSGNTSGVMDDEADEEDAVTVADSPQLGIAASTSKDKDADADNDKTRHAADSTPAKPKKKRRKRINPEEDYDLFDPFIDDTEVAEVFEAIGYPESVCPRLLHETTDDDSLFQHKGPIENEAKRHDFYIYRGELEVVPLLKEFEEQKSPRKRGKRQAKTKTKTKAEPATTASGKSATSPKKRRRRTKNSDIETSPKSKTIKKESLLDRINRLGSSDQGSDGSSEPEIQLEKHHFDHIPASNDSGSASTLAEKSSSSEKKPTAKRTDADREYAKLDYLDALNKFKSKATGIAFEATRFPSVLRASLNAYVLATLRLSSEREVAAEQLESLAKSLPFSNGSLRKLISKKILPALQDSLNEDISRSLGELRETIATRNVEMEQGEKPAAVLDLVGVASQSSQSQFEPTQATVQQDAGSRKFRWTEAIRQLVYSIVRNEIDLVYVTAALQYILMAHARGDVLVSNSERMAETAGEKSKPATENMIRRSVYRKILECFDASWGMTSIEIGREFAIHKRKLERILFKAHGRDMPVRQAKRKVLSSAKFEDSQSGIAEGEEPPSTPEEPLPKIAKLESLHAATNAHDDIKSDRPINPQ